MYTIFIYTASNLLCVPVCNQDEVARFLIKGYKNRSIASTYMIEHSSRAHTIATIYVKQIQSNAKATLSSQIRIVDLAGRYVVFLTSVFCRKTPLYDKKIYNQRVRRLYFVLIYYLLSYM